MKPTKQVIVVKKFKDLRKGKYIAQGSHASGAFMADIIKNKKELTEAENDWLENSFTKVCLYVNTEEELDEVFIKAKAKGLKVFLITDSGKTEFHGVPTKTCLAIGPDYSEKIDEVTGHLPLF